ncbi:MAG TPA: DUF1579 domain-containing protein [Acidobacteriota bacterium]|nr:DUF1579 domain-containing protein [Acidobacteriota bacterium]
MKQLIGTVAACLLLTSASALAQNQDEEMKAWMELNKPGQEHRYIEQFSGNWDVSVTMWHAPGAPPTNSKGTAEHRMILDGRYLQQHFKSDMMGTPFEGMGLWGYDNAKKEHVSTWVDSMSTGIFTATGKSESAGKSFTFTGEYKDPKGQTRKAKEILRFQDPNKIVAEMFEIGADGKEFKNMEMIYTRRK